MRKSIVLSALAVLAGMVAGCTTVSKSEYQTAQVVLRESPTTRRQATAECAADLARKSPVEKANLAAFLNVSVTRMPTVFCARVFSAMANGRLSYEDVFAARRSGNYAAIIRALQGR